MPLLRQREQACAAESQAMQIRQTIAPISCVLQKLFRRSSLACAPLPIHSTSSNASVSYASSSRRSLSATTLSSSATPSQSGLPVGQIPAYPPPGPAGWRHTAGITFCVRGVASPLLANVYMNRFLKHWRLTGREGAFRAYVVVYADDYVILSRGYAQEALAWSRAVMTKLGLKLNEDKTSVKDAARRASTF